MSVYEIIAVVFSSVALLTSIPAIFLTIRQYRNLSFKIEFQLEISPKVLLFKNDEGGYKGGERISVINKSDQSCTINKIGLLDGDKEFELYCQWGNGSAAFINVPLAGNAILSRYFFLSLKNLPKNQLVFKIYTNRKTFTKKMPYQLQEPESQQLHK